MIQRYSLLRARHLLALAAVLLLLTPALADKTGGRPLTATERQQQLDSFEKVWQTVRDKHWDPKLHGLDWQAIHDELKPRVEKAATAEEARAAMMEMLGRLGQSHFAIIPADGASGGSKEEEKTPSGSGRTGLDVRVVGSEALVVQVADDSPAAKAGVRAGWQILKVANREVAAILAKVRLTYKESTMLDCRLARAVDEQLRGMVGAKLPIVFRDASDQEVTRELTLTRPKGTLAEFGHIGGIPVQFEAKLLDGNIGYLVLSAFFDPVMVMQGIEKALHDFQKADGIILDLRGNHGGIGAMAMGIGNRFVSKPDQKLGTMIMRDSTLHFTLYPQAEIYTGPLAILVDGCSASTSEILAGGLQDLKRARIFGTRTAGAALPSEIVLLPNGDGFQYAVANYVSANGEALEGRGVQPDVEVKLRRADLLAGRDAVVAAAVAWLKSARAQ